MYTARRHYTRLYACAKVQLFHTTLATLAMRPAASGQPLPTSALVHICICILLLARCIWFFFTLRNWLKQNLITYSNYWINTLLIYFIYEYKVLVHSTSMFSCYSVIKLLPKRNYPEPREGCHTASNAHSGCDHLLYLQLRISDQRLESPILFVHRIQRQRRVMVQRHIFMRLYDNLQHFIFLDYKLWPGTSTLCLMSKSNILNYKIL